MTDDEMDRIVALLGDPLIRNIRSCANERPLPWSEFRRMPLPADIDAQQAWRLLCALRRQTAVMLPFPDGRGRYGWYSYTRSLQNDLSDIDRRSHEGSWLDSTIRSRDATYFLIGSRVDDAVTAIREDGLDIGHERAREVLLGERPPEDSCEILLSNEHQVLWNLEDYRTTPCSPELILDIYRKVSGGVGEQTTASHRQESPIWEKGHQDALSTLGLISNVVNGKDVDRSEHPLLLAMAVRYLFMSTLPLPSWNGTVTSLVMKLLLIKSRLPVLAHVPILKALREWETGSLRPPDVLVPVAQSQVLIDDEVDYTINVGVAAQLVRRALDQMEDELRRVLERDETFLEALHKDIGLNHRQRIVLQVALANPGATFHIESYRKTHRIAYATARHDLLDLVEKGLLVMTYEGRAMAFRRAPKMETRIAADR